jgi:hypothetical protein
MSYTVVTTPHTKALYINYGTLSINLYENNIFKVERHGTLCDLTHIYYKCGCHNQCSNGFECEDICNKKCMNTDFCKTILPTDIQGSPIMVNGYSNGVVMEYEEYLNIPAPIRYKGQYLNTSGDVYGYGYFEFVGQSDYECEAWNNKLYITKQEYKNWSGMFPYSTEIIKQLISLYDISKIIVSTDFPYINNICKLGVSVTGKISYPTS